MTEPYIIFPSRAENFWNEVDHQIKMIDSDSAKLEELISKWCELKANINELNRISSNLFDR